MSLENDEGLDELIDFETRRPRRKIVIEPLIVLYIVAGFPMTSVISQFMVYKVADNMGLDYGNLSSPTDSDTCVSNHSDQSYIQREQVQAEAANWNMYRSLVEFLPAVITPIIYGSMGDRIGRRLLFIFPCIGSIISVSIYMAIIWFDLPIWVTLFASVEYLFGGFGVLFTGAFSYISDTVPQKHRALRMTIIDAVALINGAIANLFVGYWIRAQGFFWPLVFVIGGRAVALLYAICLVPETLTKHENNIGSRNLKWQDLFGALKLSLHDDGSGRRWKINTLLCCYLASEVISTTGVTTMYLMNVPLCWESVKLGYYCFIHMLVMCICMLVASAVPGRYLAAEWKVVFSKISYISGNVYMAMAVTSLMMYFAPLLGCLSFLSQPMLRYLFSNIVGPDEQASVFGLMNVFTQVTMVAGSILASQLYEHTLTILHGGIVFLVAGVCGFVSLCIILLYIMLLRQEKRGLLERETGLQVGDVDTEAGGVLRPRVRSL